MRCSLACVFAVGASASALGPTVEIATGVHMPTMNLGTCCGSEPQVGLPGWFAAGGVGVDTAWDYLDQPVIAASLKTLGVKREDVFITSKVPAGIGFMNNLTTTCAVDPEAALQYVREDLLQLGVDHVDLVILHGPCELMNVSDPAASNNALWTGLQQALAQGLTRAIGVSNYNAEQLTALNGPAPAVNQCFMSINGTGFFPPFLARDEPTIAYCQAKGIVYESYEAVSGCPTHDARVQAIAKGYGKTTVQVCLRWVLERGCAIAAGTGSDATTAAQYAKENLALYDFSLTAEEVAYLNSI